MSYKLYVGSLPYKTTDEDLSGLFAEYGTVESAVVIKDKFSGQSKGFGFVELSSAEEGQAAIKALDGSDFEGRKLVVNEARPKEDRPARY